MIDKKIALSSALSILLLQSILINLVIAKFPYIDYQISQLDI